MLFVLCRHIGSLQRLYRRMVTIINGEIIQDDDPRAQAFRQRGRRQEQQYEQPEQWPHGSEGRNPPAEGAGGTVFDQLNNRLLATGFPRWNLGQNVVEPIVSVALIFALVFFGVRGVLLVGVAWFFFRQSHRR